MLESNFTIEEKGILIELISNEQLKYMIAQDKYNTDEYKQLEKLKTKIKNMQGVNDYE